MPEDAYLCFPGLAFMSFTRPLPVVVDLPEAVGGEGRGDERRGEGERRAARDGDARFKALGVEPLWEEGEVWTGELVGARARRWGWQPVMGLDDALAELKADLRARADDAGLGPLRRRGGGLQSGGPLSDRGRSRVRWLQLRGRRLRKTGGFL